MIEFIIINVLLIDPTMFDEVQWPMKLAEMDPVLGNQVSLDEHVRVFVRCLGQ